MKNKYNTISGLYKRLLITISTVLILGVIVFGIVTEYIEKNDKTKLEKSLIEEEKRIFLKLTVNNAITYMDYIQSSTSQLLKENLQINVTNAWEQAMNIYKDNKGKKSDGEIKKLIISALKPLRYFDGRGYIYIIDMKGILLQHPYYPELVGTSILEMKDISGINMISEEVKLMEKNREAFYTYLWSDTKGNNSLAYKKTSFLKRFEPFNWFFGCGEYENEFENHVKKETLEWLKKSYNPKQCNLFINQFDGTSLIINSKQFKAGVNIKDLSDNNGKKIFQEELKIAYMGKGDYLYYNWPDSNGIYIPKLAYVTGYSKWNWMVGASSDLDKLNYMQLSEKQNTHLIIRYRVFFFTFFLLFMFLLLLHFIKKTNKIIEKNFITFLKQFENFVAEKNPLKIVDINIEELQKLSLDINKLLLIHIDYVKSLTESEEKFRVVVDNAPVMIMGIDSDGKVLLWNQKCELFFGYNKEDVIGKFAPVKQLFGDELVNELKEEMFKPNSNYSLFPVILKNGTKAYQYWASFKISENLIIWVGNDVTALKNAETELIENRNFLDTLLQSIPTPIFYKGIDGKYLGANSSFYELVNKTPDEIIGKSVFELYSNNLAIKYNQMDEAVFRGESQKYDNKFGEEGKETKDFTYYKAPYFNSKMEIAGLIGIMLDISERVKIEKKLKEQECELRELNSTKDKFFSIIAHDLKNPFNVMLNIGEMISESLKAGELKETEEYVKILNAATRQGYDLLVNLLEWARSQTGSINYSPKYQLINDTLINISELFDAMMVSKEIKFTTAIEKNLEIPIDINMLNTILRNLLTNAVKYTPRNGAIKLEAYRKADCVEICVSDSGIGMTSEDTEKLFSINKCQSHNGTEGEVGTGLGLILCNEFVKKHSGNISVESELGKGTSFRVSFPIHAAPLS